MYGPNQDSALGYPYPKWHPYYGWGWGQGAPQQPQRMIGDPNQRPPGSWFGRPVVGALTLAPSSAPAVQVGSALLVGGAAYLATRSLLSAVIGAGAAALLVSVLPIWADAGPSPLERSMGHL